MYGTENVLSFVPFVVEIPYDVLTAEGLAVRSLNASDAAAPASETAKPH